jgi:hypothetical protein
MPFVARPQQFQRVLKNSTYPFLAKTGVSILLNPAFLEGFSLDVLVNWATTHGGIKQAAMAAAQSPHRPLELGECLDWFADVEQIGGESEWLGPQ